MRLSRRDMKRLRASRGGGYGLHFILGLAGLLVAGSNLLFGSFLGLGLQIPDLVTNLVLFLVSVFIIFAAFRLHRV